MDKRQVKEVQTMCSRVLRVLFEARVVVWWRCRCWRAERIEWSVSKSKSSIAARPSPSNPADQA